MKLNWNRLHSRPSDELSDFLFYADGTLVGFLALYIFNSREAEISAMVAPAYRRQGVFSQLLAEARRELIRRQVPSLLFICEQNSLAGQAVMQALGAAYEFSEYRMDLRQIMPPIESSARLQLRTAQPDDIRLMAEMDDICFQISADLSEAVLQKELAQTDRKKAFVATVNGAIIGKIHTLTMENLASIIAFCILPEYRRQGYGSAILSRTVAGLVEQGHRRISLEVETKNDQALHLYRRCGFEVTTAYNYFRLAADV